MNWIGKGGLLAALCYVAHSAAATDDDQIKLACDKVDSYAQAGASAYQHGNLAKAIDEYTAQAGWSEFCRRSQREIQTAYNNIALMLIRNDEPLQARAWLNLAPDNDKSRYNLTLLQPILTRLTPALASTPMGQYWRYAGQGVWSSVSVMPADNDQWKITFNGYYMPGMGMFYGPNIGQFTTIQSIDNNKSIYAPLADSTISDAPCQVDMLFEADRLHLTQGSGDCGFGMNVAASGEFLRVSLY